MHQSRIRHLAMSLEAGPFCNNKLKKRYFHNWFTSYQVKTNEKFSNFSKIEKHVEKKFFTFWRVNVDAIQSKRHTENEIVDYLRRKSLGCKLSILFSYKVAMTRLIFIVLKQHAIKKQHARDQSRCSVEFNNCRLKRSSYKKLKNSYGYRKWSTVF